MANRARSDKRVLSKQAVAARKRSLAETKGGDGTRTRALLGLILMAGSILALFSLLTFDARDRVGPGFHNAVGPVGHAISELFFGALGYCAYVLPLAGGYTAMVLFLGGEGKRRWPQIVAAFLLVTSSSVLVQLAFADPHRSFPPGGALGASLDGFLEGLFSTLGTWIIVSATCAAALLIGTRFAFVKMCSFLWGSTRELAERGWVAAMAFLAAQKQAWDANRERAAQAKLEEAAFLAQLEADEEELSEVEQEAEEAEAVAEEAIRLTKEAYGKKRLEAETSARAVVAEKKERKAAVPAVPAAIVPIAVAAQPAAPTPKGPEASSLPSPAAALSRMPVIVEPKAPPKPSQRRETQEFQFIGDRKSFSLPPMDVLECDRQERSALDKEAFLATAEKLRDKLADFGISGEVVEIRPGPVVTMYEFLPGPGIKVSKIASLADDLAMAMEAMRVRIVAPIPGKGVVGIEVPNKDRETVFLKEIAEQDAFAKSNSKLTMCLGKDIEGMPFVFDLAKAPHLLIAGTTGSGKSVAVNSMIMSILLKATPEEVRFVMVDPKMLELSVYEGIPHLLLPVVTDPKKAALALRWSVEEMERRYHLLSEAGVRNIAGYNKLIDSAKGTAKNLLKAQDERSKKASTADGKAKKLLVVDVAEGESEEEALARIGSESTIGVPAPKDEPDEISASEEATVLEVVPEATGEGSEEEKQPAQKLPYIVVIIDELADLMMVASREVETYIARLAQMARAAGIHLMVATQRPSTDVVTGIIKANFPTRISFMLRSKPDSMTILGTTGAEALLGMGDMLIMPPTSAHMIRVHGAYVSEPEIKRVVDHLKAQGKPVYNESILKPREDETSGAGEEDELSDELWDQALAVVTDMRQVSISMLQRKMRIGYNRAARMIERMEREGVVGPADGAKPREVLLRPIGEMPGTGAA